MIWRGLLIYILYFGVSMHIKKEYYTPFFILLPETPFDL